MGGEDLDVTSEIFSLLAQYVKEKEAHRCLAVLAIVMHRPDGPELVRLMQKWMAVS